MFNGDRVKFVCDKLTHLIFPYEYLTFEDLR